MTYEIQRCRGANPRDRHRLAPSVHRHAFDLPRMMHEGVGVHKDVPIELNTGPYGGDIVMGGANAVSQIGPDELCPLKITRPLANIALQIDDRRASGFATSFSWITCGITER